MGTWGYYIPVGQECINTEAKCRAHNGWWGGTEMGRGRTPGCSLPTKDAGKTCTDADQCEGGCLADTSGPIPAPAGQQVRCRCSASTATPKGETIGICTKRGIDWLIID